MKPGAYFSLFKKIFFFCIFHYFKWEKTKKRNLKTEKKPKL